jgi:hypothetical protein
MNHCVDTGELGPQGGIPHIGAPPGDARRAPTDGVDPDDLRALAGLHEPSGDAAPKLARGAGDSNAVAHCTRSATL